MGTTCRSLIFGFTLTGALSFGAVPLMGQIPTARVVGKGVLRLSLSPFYVSYDRRFAKDTPGVPDDSEEPLGTDLTADSVGANFFPTLRAPEMAIGGLIGDSTFRLNIGAVNTDLDADIRRFPIEARFGLSDRLSLRLAVPIVTARMNATLTVDNANGNVALNSPNPDQVEATRTLIGELEGAATSLEDQIASGAFGCPMSPTCTTNQDLAGRTRNLITAIETITGITADGAGSLLPPFVPTAGSNAGMEVQQVVQDIANELTTAGAGNITSSLSFPDSAATADDIQNVLVSPLYGYNGFPIEMTKLSRLGDIEVGARYALATRDHFRAVLTGNIRLPTGTYDQSNNFIDLGTGDKQTDLEGGIELWLSSGVLSLAFKGSYNLQLARDLPRRVTPPNRPIALARDEFTVNRNLGDEIRLGVYPSLQLDPAFRVFASFNYYRKQADKFTTSSPISTFTGAVIEDLARETFMKSVAFGGGLAYRYTGPKRNALPVEAGLHYRAVFDGSGGLTPKWSGISLYLRLFYRLFGGETKPEPAPSGENE